MCFEIHTHTNTRKVSVCVLIIDPVAGLDSTYLLSVIGLHYNLFALASIDTIGHLLPPLLLPLSLLYTYLVSESIDAICLCSIHLSATKVVEVRIV